MAAQSPTRMFIMLPLLFLMNKVNFEDPNILFMARTSFFICQIVQFVIAMYVKSAVTKKPNMKKIYIAPAPASPFAPPPETTGMTETTYFEHESKKAQEFLQQAMIGACISSFIHFKFGVSQVVLIQSVMIPMNLFENVLVKATLFGRAPDARIWDEKFEGEDLSVPATTDSTTAAASKKAVVASSKSPVPTAPKEAITHTWDEAGNADFDGLFERVKKCPDVKTADDGWTALMVACGSPLDTTRFITNMVKANAKANVKDNDGWTALHWAAFHGRASAAKTLLSSLKDGEVKELLKVTDAKDQTASDVAMEEGNTDVVDVLNAYVEDVILEDSKDSADGIRQRKGKVDKTEIADID